MAPPTFTEAELGVIDHTFRERFGMPMILHDAPATLPALADDCGPGVCPVLCWRLGHCYFVLSKTRDGRYRGAFFYRVEGGLSPGHASHTDLADCLMCLYRMQADDAARRAQLAAQQ
jgi:hypothetical protein